MAILWPFYEFLYFYYLFLYTRMDHFICIWPFYRQRRCLARDNTTLLYNKGWSFDGICLFVYPSEATHAALFFLLLGFILYYLFILI